MTTSATGIVVPVCSKAPLLYLLTQKAAQKFGYVLGIYNTDGRKIKNDKPYISMSFNSYFNLRHHWMPYVLLSYNSDGNMREYLVKQALWFSLGVTKHFADNAWLVRLSLNNILGTKERETRYASDYIFEKAVSRMVAASASW